MSILSGTNVYLRSLEREDLGRCWEWMHRADIYERIGVQIPFSHSRQETWFQNLEQSRDKLVMAICLKENDEHIGNVSLDSIDSRHHNARLSIFIAAAEMRGKGYGSDAVKVLIQYAFNYLNLHKIWCKVDQEEKQLTKFYTSLNFDIEGVFREHEYKNGRYINKTIFGLVRKC